MPYCTSCGNETEEDHRYCGSCGESLKNDNPPTQPPPTDPWDGFLTVRSIKYIEEIYKGENELNTEDSGYYHLSQDVAAALAELGMVAKLDGVNLLEMMWERSSGSEIMRDDTDDLTDQETYERLMWLGFFRIPELYDNTIGTDWGDQLDEKLQSIIEEYNE